MFVPPFVLPDLRLFLTCLAGIGLLFTGFRVVRFLYQRRKPARQGVLVTSRASSLLVLLCSWPLLAGAVFSFITLGGVSCFVGFYQAAPVPPASLTVVTPSDLVMLNARDGSVQRVLASNASSPTEAGGLVYFEVDGPGSEMTVHASRLSDGSQLWSTVFALTGRYQPSLVVADGMVYLWQAYQSSSKLYALRADDGSIAWNLPLQMVLQPQEQSLTAGAGLLIVAARDGSFSAWHATDGSVAWHIDGSAFPREAMIGTGSPYVFDQAVSVANQTVYFARVISPEKRDGTTVSSLLVALRASDGHYLWQRDFSEESNIAPGPIFRFGPHLYLEVYGDLYALNATDGALLWQRSGVWASAVVETGGVIYVSGSTYPGVTLEALHVGDGSQIWSHAFASSSRAGTPIVLQNVMFVSLGAREAPLFENVCPGRTEPSTAIFALNASDGSIYWRDPNVIGLLSVTGATEAFQTSWPDDL